MSRHVNEKRHCHRFEHETPIIIQTRNENRHSGRMFNFSKDGMYIETDMECRPGQEVTIVVEDPPYGQGPYLHRAEIRWACELPGAVEFYRFGCGAQWDFVADYSLDRSDLSVQPRSGVDRRSGRDRRSGVHCRRKDPFTD